MNCPNCGSIDGRQTVDDLPVIGWRCNACNVKFQVTNPSYLWWHRHDDIRRAYNLHNRKDDTT